jgi:hypothetical protein
MERPICNECKNHPCAINYKKKDRFYYRRFCDPCILKRSKNETPRWILLGYKKKNTCESCGFIAKVKEQYTVIEYNETYRTVCLNCEVEFKTYNRITIKKGDLKADF